MNGILFPLAHLALIIIDLALISSKLPKFNAKALEFEVIDSTSSG